MKHLSSPFPPCRHQAESGSIEFLTLQVAWYQVRAKNEASFRCPDQDGWQPNHEAINPEECIDSYLCTDLPIKAIIGVAHAILAILSSTLLLHHN